MTTYLVRLYSPFTLKTFAKRVDAATAEEAKKKLIGKVITDPDFNEFEVEEHYIISVAPVKAVPLPPYELMPEEDVKKAEFLKGATVLEPLPKGAEPVGSPRLAAVIPNSFTTLLYQQEVRSKCIRFLEPYGEIKVGPPDRPIKTYGPYKPGDVECGLWWSKAKELCATKFRVLKSPPLMPLIDPKGRVLKEPLTGEAFQKEKETLDELLRTGKIKRETYEEKLSELKGEYVYSEPDELQWAKLQVAKGNLQQITSPITEWYMPEVKARIQYRRDIHTKFYEEARRMARARKIEEAVLYLVENSLGGLTVRQIADALELGYWTTYRAVKSWASPKEAEKLEKEADEQATLERWLPEQIEEVKRQPPARQPRISIGPQWRGQITLWPVKRKTEEELFQELKRILSLEGFPRLTPEEEQEYRRQLHEYWEKKARERLTYFLE